jgi:hypothetical protein
MVPRSLERAAFLAEVLAPSRVVPDLRVLERADDFDQPGFLGVVVKDTSATRRPRGEVLRLFWMRFSRSASMPELYVLLL